MRAFVVREMGAGGGGAAVFVVLCGVVSRASADGGGRSEVMDADLVRFTDALYQRYYHQPI